MTPRGYSGTIFMRNTVLHERRSQTSPLVVKNLIGGLYAQPSVMPLVFRIVGSRGLRLLPPFRPNDQQRLFDTGGLPRKRRKKPGASFLWRCPLPVHLPGAG